MPSDVAAGLVTTEKVIENSTSSYILFQVLLAEKHRGVVKSNRANVMDVAVTTSQPVTSELRSSPLDGGMLSSETTGPPPLEVWDRVCHYFQYAQCDSQIQIWQTQQSRLY